MDTTVARFVSLAALAAAILGACEGGGSAPVDAQAADVPSAAAVAVAPWGAVAAAGLHDASRPAAIVDLGIVDPGAPFVALRWSVPADDVGVVGYNVYRDERYVSTVPEPGWRDTEGRGDDGARYHVIAFDRARNFAPRSNEVRADAPRPVASTNADAAPIEPAPVVPLRRGDFQVFNTMLYRDMPRVGQRAAIAYEPAFFGNDAARGDGQPSDAGIDSAVADIQAQYGAPWFADPGLAVVDIERWQVWPYAEGAEHRRSIDRYASAVGRFADRLQQPVCLYAIVPQGNINFAQRSVNEPDIRTQWTRASDYARDVLLPEVDAMCPSLYTFYGSDDPEKHAEFVEGWRTFAIETIAEARRIAPDMPVYPFVWPQYHMVGNRPGLGYLPDAYWRMQLEVLRDHADGVVLWGGWDFDIPGQQGWDPDAAWYRILREVFPDV